ETSLNVLGKNYWLHVVSTAKITFQYLNKGRGADTHRFVKFLLTFNINKNFEGSNYFFLIYFF
ncbi:MAG: hypothetical protein QM539_09225, partial [Alphaproteobacteria bacterium]|nr:hypothetical protein [Alphaproteobacteria bacterium]